MDKCTRGRDLGCRNEERGKPRTNVPWLLAPLRTLGRVGYTEDSASTRLRAASRCLPRRLAVALLWLNR